MKTIIFIVFMLINTPILKAQLQGQAKIDSLLKELPKAKNDTNHVKLLALLSDEIKTINNDDGLKYAKKALSIAEKLDWAKGRAISYYSLGVNNLRKQNDSLALIYYEKALEISEDIDLMYVYAETLNDIAIINGNRANYSKELELYLKSLTISKKYKLIDLIVLTSNNLSKVYTRKLEYSKAEEYLFDALKYSKKIGNKNSLAALLNNIANTYSKNFNYKEALEYYFKALKINETKDGNNEWKIINLMNIGRIYQTKLNYSKAFDYFKKAADFSKEISNHTFQLHSLENITYLHIKLSEYPKALEISHKALKLSEVKNDKLSKARVYLMIGQIYRFQLNYKKGIENSLKGINIIEKLDNKVELMHSYNSIGVLYYYWEKYPQALEYYNKSLELNAIVNDPELKGILLGNIGLINYHQQDYEKAQNYFEEALNIHYNLNDKFHIAFASMNMANLYKTLSNDTTINKFSKDINNISFDKELNLNKAINLYSISNTVFEEIGDLYDRSKCLLGLSEAYEQTKDYKNQIKYYKLHISLRDSIYNEDNSKKIYSLEKTREDDLNRLKIEKQEIQLKAQEDEQQMIVYSAVGALFSVFLILTLIINQRRKSEKLLLNVLPAKIAKRLKAKEHPIADHFDNASIMFVDIVGFTTLSSDADPKRIVSVLNDIFIIFDKLAEKHGLEKIKTIGDAYMAVAGIPEIQSDHSKRTAQMALDIKQEMKDFKTSDGTEIKFRIGIDCGAVIAGVIGEKKFIYDLWSDAVNTASRMESTGESGKIQITDNFKRELEKFEGNWNFTLRGEFEVKGKGLMKTYFLEN